VIRRRPTDVNRGDRFRKAEVVRQRWPFFKGSPGVVKMEGISKLVSDSLARHGMEPRLDHLRLEWSRWFRCQSSFSVLLVPAKPGIFALGEEIVRAASEEERRAFSPVEGRRMLALFQLSAADDLGMALGRLFLPGHPLLAKLNSGRCLARYAVIEDPPQRRAICAIFQRWIQDSAETASGVQQPPCGSAWGAQLGAFSTDEVDDTVLRTNREQAGAADVLVRAETENIASPDSDLDEAVSPSVSSAWGAGFLEVQNREARRGVRRPAPLPSGF
jgi:hypothetical protein